MDHPYYTVTVTNLTRGWTYSTVEGEEWDPADDVVLASPFGFVWAFSGELVPGHLNPCQADVNLVCRDVADIPVVDQDDLMAIDVRVGTTGPRIIDPPPFKVSAVNVDIDDIGHPGYAAQVSLELTDILTDLLKMFPQPNQTGGDAYPIAEPRWRARLAEVSAGIGMTLSCPTWWSKDERPLPVLGAPSLVAELSALTAWDAPAADIARRLLNSHQPDGYTHTVTPGHDAVGTYPAGWENVGDTTYWGRFLDNSDGAARAFTTPESDYRYYLVPASRSVGSGNALPLMLVEVAGVLTIQPVFSTGRGHARGAIHADWCDLPVSARRSREHVIGTVSLTGQERFVEDRTAGTVTLRESRRTYGGGAGAVRELETELFFGETADSDGGPLLTAQEPPVVADLHLSDAATAGSGWAYDGFTLESSRIPQDIADELLPALAPRFPGETDGDGHVARHVTLYGIAGRARHADQAPITGFVSTGKMTITGGDIVWTITLTPGLPQWSTAPDPITLQDLVDDFGLLTFDDVGPHIQFGDLAYVEGSP